MNWQHPTAEDLAHWSTINSWPEFGQRNAEWLSGEFIYHPRYLDDSPATETGPLIEILTKINRAGFVTTDSQPGHPADAFSYVQRAYMTGICDEPTASRLRSGLLRTDLVVLWFSPDRSGIGQVAVTRDAQEECTWLGYGGVDEHEVDAWTQRGGPGLGQLYLDSWELHIFDPAWGRNDLLWTSVLAALTNPTKASS
jgi:hypothetical protein